MQEFMKIYNEYQDDINNFLYDTVGSIGDMRFLVFDWWDSYDYDCIRYLYKFKQKIIMTIT